MRDPADGPDLILPQKNPERILQILAQDPYISHIMQEILVVIASGHSITSRHARVRKAHAQGTRVRLRRAFFLASLSVVFLINTLVVYISRIRLLLFIVSAMISKTVTRGRSFSEEW